MTIIQDRGHGNDGDTGAVGPGGTRESDVVVKFAQSFGFLCSCNGWPVVDIPRTKLAERIRFVNGQKTGVVVSWHCNAAKSSAAHGTEVYTYFGTSESDRIAQKVLFAIRCLMKELTIRYDMSDGDLDKEANFAILRDTNKPAILIETAFISNPNEERLLNDDKFVFRYATAVLIGMSRYEAGT